MIYLLSLIIIYALYIYVFESRVRHAVLRKLNPFDENLVKRFSQVAKRLGNKAYWSNIILVCGIAISVSLLFYTFKQDSSAPNSLILSLSLFLQILALTISASFPGDTWIKCFRTFINQLNNNYCIKFFTRFLFELFSFCFLVLPFLTIVSIFILSFADGSHSIVRTRMIFYFLPIFFVMWIYRLGDYNQFQLNVRRVFVYTFVASVLLLTGDPLLQLSKQNTSPQSAFDFGRMFNEFSILAFLALDRVGKVAIELLANKEMK